MSATLSSSSTTSVPAADTSSEGSHSNRRNAVATFAVLVITGAVIFAAAYFSNPQLAATADAGNFTAITVDSQSAGVGPVVDQPAPDFVATTTDGKTVRLSDFRGTPVWLTFGASWCQPCRAENPDIEATYNAYAGRIVLLQVYIGEDAATVRDYTGRVGLTYTTIPDTSQRLAGGYRILGIPSHFFIDSGGVLRQMKIGSMDPVTMKAALDSLGE